MSRRLVEVVCAIGIVAMLACGDSDTEKPNTAGKGGSGGRSGAGAGKGGANAGSGGSGGGGEINHIDRSGLTDVGTSDPLDYAKPELWLCRPDNDPDLCARNADATELKADGSRAVVKHEPASDPEADCFYVYPSVFMTGAPQMVNFTDDGVKPTLDPIMSQAARFSRVCNIYAPAYRQSGIVAGQFVAGSDDKLAAQDVRDAFAYYLEHLNRGRKFVLLGHSQGTFMLTALVQSDVDDKPAVRAKMLSAILLGGHVAVPKGQLKGDTFKNVPLCSNKGETGCVITYASFAAGSPPMANAKFGMAENPDSEAACVEPAALAGNDGAYKGSFFPAMLVNTSFKADTSPPSDIETPFVVYREMFRGKCKTSDKYRYLEYELLTPASDPRGVPPWRHTLVDSLGFGTHLVDFNIAMDDLIGAVSAQIEASKD